MSPLPKAQTRLVTGQPRRSVSRLRVDRLKPRADRLQERWTQASTVPTFAAEADVGGEGAGAEAADELTTLEEMLGWRRPKRAAAPL